MTDYQGAFACAAGRILVAVDESGSVTGIRFVDFSPEQTPDSVPGAGPSPGGSSRTVTVRRQLAEYFAGRRRVFNLPLAPRGTPFQRAVWRELARIPYGQTRSYAQIAAALGRPGAARAVGRAVGANPLQILIPCHRVIGAGGGLTGFAGGLAAKKFLLELERRSRPREPMRGSEGGTSPCAV